MKSKISNPYFHILFWIIVLIILTGVFGRSWGNSLPAYYFISLLLPVVMGTSYFFNYYLVPQFLLKKKYFWFVLYFFYTLVVSLYLEMLVLTFSLIYLANFDLGQMGLNSSDTLLLAVVLYMVVFFSSFLLMVQQLFESHRELEELKIEKKKMEIPFLGLISNRKSVRIPYYEIVYIESLADYIKVHSIGKREIGSKEKISAIEEKLPSVFIRIHRSFIVNSERIARFNSNEVELDGIVLNIGRSYKKQVLLKLRNQNK
ncbi:MAG: hypothetical protein HN778_08890 [Prolixibacteraceae bacterium]|nr:hypothetical protein [Prolixibacteraceae bacterium]MBT6006754.1 hypothetical protein [Prolixibacteraceae bacterium]MBT6766631.1 hypothetical protein [Prolixibacteraceae bacterium]MBT6997625.1 hypothetical protein [Prolixibacteraceae bacterium]MBT7394932.1 hypothetical protein [Prolixibacteraceae bacterium]